MIPYDIDPSLHTGEPKPAVLDDGFSPPQAHERAPDLPAPARNEGGFTAEQAAKPY
jgi:hypothetical protein